MNPEDAWHYHSEVRRAATHPDLGQLDFIKTFLVKEANDIYFQVSLDTARFRPIHRITLRTSLTGAARDLVGGYWSGGWRFYLPITDFREKKWEATFYLDGVPQTSAPLVIDGAKNSHFNESDLSFPPTMERLHHDYENLRVAEDWEQHNLLRSNCSPKNDGVWDVIVVGTGMGGGVLADALSDFKGKDIRVLAIDAGSFDYDTHTDNMPTAALGRFVVEEGENIYETHDVITYHRANDFGGRVTMNLGGRSVFWSGLIPRMGDWELVNWPPSVRKYLAEKGYAAAEKLMRKHLTNGTYQDRLIEGLGHEYGDFWRVENTPRSCDQPEFMERPQGGVHLQESIRFRSTGTFSTAELLVDSHRAVSDPRKGKLHLKLNHLAIGLKMDGSKVAGVICKDLLGDREVIFPGRHVVLAAGSIESPKIAMLSKLEPKKLIGLGLTDHPSYFSPNDGEFPLKTTSPFYGPDKHARIFLYPKKDYHGYWFNVEIVINGRYWRVRHADDDVLNVAELEKKGTTVKFKFIFGSPLDDGNRITLDPANELGKVHVQVAKNSSGEKAKEVVRAFADDLLKFFHAEPVNLKEDKNFHFGNGGTPHHAGGTLRMEANGQSGVVDENLKFVNYDNLYACDPSVYPYIPAANPSLTLVALAQRLAEHLGSKF